LRAGSLRAGFASLRRVEADATDAVDLGIYATIV
jgi:hypothetical protein